LTKLRSEGERFANPLIEQNGTVLKRDINAYGPDVVSDYAVNFISENKDRPFFIYYPMLLVHDPFVPTPDSPECNSIETRSKSNRKFFKDMEKNWDYQEVYKNYLEVRLDVYSNINKLYDDNSDCIVSGDQEISTEQVKEAEKDLSDFISKYEN
jgi:hypothetical protein